MQAVDSSVFIPELTGYTSVADLHQNATEEENGKVV
jgi:hypothetical protein